MSFGRAALLGLALASALATRLAADTAADDRASLIAPAPATDGNAPGADPDLACLAIVAADAPVDAPCAGVAPAHAAAPAPAPPSPLRVAPKTSPPRA
jgi:hypothetical protein